MPSHRNVKLSNIFSFQKYSSKLRRTCHADFQVLYSGGVKNMGRGTPKSKSTGTGSKIKSADVI